MNFIKWIKGSQQCRILRLYPLVYRRYPIHIYSFLMSTYLQGKQCKGGCCFEGGTSASPRTMVDQRTPWGHYTRVLPLAFHRMSRGAHVFWFYMHLLLYLICYRFISATYWLSGLHSALCKLFYFAYILQPFISPSNGDCVSDSRLSASSFFMPILKAVL